MATDEDRRLVQHAFGETLKFFRKRAGVAQETLASKSGVDHPYLSGLEHGKRNPTLATIYRILTALGVSGPDFAREFERTLKRLRTKAKASK